MCTFTDIVLFFTHTVLPTEKDGEGLVSGQRAEGGGRRGKPQQSCQEPRRAQGSVRRKWLAAPTLYAYYLAWHTIANADFNNTHTVTISGIFADLLKYFFVNI
jgi:hypothetical protein